MKLITAGDQPKNDRVPNRLQNEDAYARAEKLLESGKLDEAIELLQNNPGLKEDPEAQGLLGAAYYRQERYEAAADSFQLAAAGEEDSIYAGLAVQARQNHATDIATDHARNPFDPAVVNGAPQPGDPGIASDSKLEIQRSWFSRTARGALNLGGKVVGGVSGAALALGCKLFGKEDEEEIWTTWSRKNFAQALLILKGHRDHLNANNLHDTYPEGELTGFAKPQKAPEWAKHNRTFDGSFNNLSNPKEGAAGTRFGRNVPREMTHVDETKMFVENPRMISRLLQTRKDGMKEVPFLNMMAVWWIQMETHDWVSHGDNKSNEVYEIPLAKDDPKRQQLKMTHMLVPKTADDPSRRADEANGPKTYLNEVTHWWDGSQLYGSSEAQNKPLREGKGGRMKLDAKGNLPLGKDGVEMTGFSRNWTTGLSVMHTLFVKEHNAIADMLADAYPNWGPEIRADIQNAPAKLADLQSQIQGLQGQPDQAEELAELNAEKTRVSDRWDAFQKDPDATVQAELDSKIFHKARLINSALMAKIHTKEWTPNVLPNPVLDSAMQANWDGALTRWFRSEDNQHAVATFNVVNEAAGGLVGNPIEKHGVPAWLSEEFVSDYAMLHSMLPDEIRINPIDPSKPKEALALNEIRQKKASDVVDKYGHGDLIHSFGTQHPGQLVLNNFPETLQNIAVPGFGFMDLAAVDLIRDDERGVPRYNDMREALGLKRIKSFEDLGIKDPQTLADLKLAYNNNVDRIHFKIGCLAEEIRPENFGFGETQFQIFILHASRRLQSDRFYTTDYTPEVYTPEGLAWIDANGSKSVALRHHPELANTGLKYVRTLFEPFDTDPAQLADKARHPLGVDEMPPEA